MNTLHTAVLGAATTVAMGGVQDHGSNKEDDDAAGTGVEASGSGTATSDNTIQSSGDGTKDGDISGAAMPRILITRATRHQRISLYLYYRYICYKDIYIYCVPETYLYLLHVYSICIVYTHIPNFGQPAIC